MKEQEKPVKLSELESDVGEAQELPPQEKARLSIAFNVLSAVMIIVVMAGVVLIYGPDNRVEEAKIVFDFVKTIAPPIVTLVIGFYFRSESA